MKPKPMQSGVSDRETSLPHQEPTTRTLLLPKVRKQIGDVLAINMLLVAPVMLSLFFVRELPQAGSPGNTPYGYSVALLIWYVPTLAIAVWLLRRKDLPFERSCCWQTLGILIPIGFVLDLLFGNAFFTYSNPGAVVGIHIPAIGGPLPIEEFLFFVAAFSFVVLTYVWADEYWLAAYHVAPPSVTQASSTRRLRFHAAAVWVSIAIFGIAVLYKTTLARDSGGFPWYLAYILAVAIVPPAGFFPVVARFVNWRAFLFTQLAMLLVCLVFEATLGVPYAWWGFRSEMMTGIYLTAWSNLPIEEPFVWLASPFTCVVTFELVKFVRRSKSIPSTNQVRADV